MSTLFFDKRRPKRACHCWVERSKSSPDLKPQSAGVVVYGESVEDDDEKSECIKPCFNAVCQTEISLGRDNEDVVIVNDSDPEEEEVEEEDLINEDNCSCSHFNLNAETKIWHESVERKCSMELLSGYEGERLKEEVKNSEDNLQVTSEIDRVNQKLMDYELHKARKFNNVQLRSEEENSPSVSNLSSNAYMIESLTPSEFSPPDLLPSDVQNHSDLSPPQSEVELKITDLESEPGTKSSTKISISNDRSMVQIFHDQEPANATPISCGNEIPIRPTKLKIRIGDSKIKISTNETVSMKGMVAREKFLIPHCDSNRSKAITSESHMPKSYTKVQICTRPKPITVTSDVTKTRGPSPETPYKILCKVSPSKSLTSIRSNRRTKICIIPTETTVNLMPTLVSSTCQTEVPLKQVPSQRILSTVENTLTTYENEIQPLRDALSALQSKIRSLHITDFPSLNYKQSALTIYDPITKPPVSLTNAMSYSNFPSCACRHHDRYNVPIRHHARTNMNYSNVNMNFDSYHHKINALDVKTSHQSKCMYPSKKPSTYSNDLPGFVPVTTDPSDFFDRPNTQY